MYIGIYIESLFAAKNIPSRNVTYEQIKLLAVRHKVNVAIDISG